MIDFNNFIELNTAEMYRTLKELATIPAPSGHEEERAKYCLEFLKACGSKDAYIDSALNVVLPINIEGKDSITVIGAHTDVVFDFDVPLNYVEKDGKIFCPGIGDDTASAVVLMYTAKYLIENNIKPQNGLIIVLDSCEEGMGNLKGIRQLMDEFGGRIKEFITYDSNFDSIANECVGSHRYKVTVKTEGGHSFADFGNANAINELAKIVNKIYNLSAVEKEGSHTTYNVGIIEGGTSVNTIAQNASMLCEYRSDNRECLEVMKDAFMDIFASCGSDDVAVEVETVGERPCSAVDKNKQMQLSEKVKKVCDEIYGLDVYFRSGSTDCNIPMSMGIPAVNMGVYIGGKSHTTEEWIDKESILKGLLASLKLIDELCIMRAKNEE